MSRRPTPISDFDPDARAQARTRGARRPPTPPASRSGGFPGGCAGLIGLVVLLFLFGPVLLEMSVDWQWFGSLGLQNVFGTRISAAVGTFAVGFVIAAVFLAVNWLIARRVAVPANLFPGQQLSISTGMLRLGIIVGIAVAALLLGFAAGDEWSTLLTYFNHTAFGSSDPVFGQDIAFYVFELPFYEFLRGWGIGLIVVAAIGAALIYATRPTLLVSNGRFAPDPRMVAHGTALGVAFLVLMAVGYWFQTYDLLFSEHKALYGAAYTDVNARLLALRILAVVTLGIGLLLLVNLRRRALLPLAVGVGVWIIAQVVIGGIYPTIVQSFVVTPAEQDKEAPYITNNIQATRAAFGPRPLSGAPGSGSRATPTPRRADQQRSGE